MKPSKKKTTPLRSAGVSGPLAKLLGRTGIAPPPAATADKPAELVRLLAQAEQRRQSGELHPARELVDHALARWPHDTQALNIKAVLAAQLGELNLAEATWRDLLKRDPTHPDARSNLGRLMQLSSRYEEALELLQKAVKDRPNHADAHMNLGVTFDHLGRYSEALASYERCLALQPRNAQAVFNIGKLLQDQQDFVRAHAHYREALVLDPAHQGASANLANLAFIQHYLPDFDPAFNRETARQFSTQLRPRTVPLAPRRVNAGPLRVGLVSADLRTHPVGYFLQSVLAHLDRSRLQLVAYSNSAHEDETTAVLKPHFGAWRHIHALNDTETSQQISDDQIDVLVDISGLSAGHRQGVFALKPARIQATWLGYFSTTGNPAIDYVLADAITVPTNEEAFFVERVWRLPDIRYCFTPPHPAPSVTLLPAKLQGHVTFGCFQTLPKINDRVLRCWAAILKEAPTARLRIQNAEMDTSTTRACLEQRLQTFGFPQERIELVGAQSRSEYLASYACVDIVLDTFPYPGGTTTAEALWMGVPTLSLAQPGMLGRQGEAMLYAVGLKDWVTCSERDYIDTAVAWANGGLDLWESLATLRSKLRERASVSPLFDATRFARHLEDAFQGMCNALAAPDAPDH